MEMSLAYMQETAEHLVKQGFVLSQEVKTLGEVEGGNCMSHRFRLERPCQRFVMETIEHPRHGLRYFLQIEEFHSMRSFAFPLDSWKHRPDRIEFKYYSLPEDGRGLSFVLSFSDGTGRS